MARSPFYIEVKDAIGAPVPTGVADIRKRSDGTAATVYNAESGGSSITNPVAADSLGRIVGWLDRGEYNANISGTGITAYTIPINATPAGDHEIDANWFALNYSPTILTNTGAGTSPAGPADGDKFLWVPALSQVAPAEFRYDAASASPYKWECVGSAGFSTFQGEGGTKSVTSGLFVNWGTGWSGGGSPDLVVFTAPFTGEYDVAQFICLNMPSAVQTAYSAGVSVNGSSSTFANGADTVNVANYMVCMTGKQRVTCNAGDTFDLRGSYVATGGPYTVTNHGAGIRVVPARIL